MSVAIPIKHCRLKFLSQLNMGQSPPSEDVTRFDEGDGLPFLQGNAEFGSVSPSYKHTCNNPPKTAVMGDLLVSVRAPVGALNVADQTYGIGRGLCALKWTRIDLRFGWGALHHHRVKLNEVATGSTYEAVSAEDLGNLVLSFPDEQSQRLIANYLDRETARIDGLIAEKERMLALLEEKRAALISRAVTRGLDPNAPLKSSGQEWLGEIPMHWGLQRLKQLSEVRGGLTLGKQYSGELLEYPYLRVANVQDGYLKLDDILTVEVPASEAASNLLAFGDVLMNEGGDIDKLGRGCVWREEITPCLHQNHVFAVRPHSVGSDWLALWTSTLEAKRYFESRAKRSTNLASISGSNIKELPVPLPPTDEQNAIQLFLAVRQARLEKIRSELRASLKLLAERRAALITAAVTGQIPLEAMRG